MTACPCTASLFSCKTMRKARSEVRAAYLRLLHTLTWGGQMVPKRVSAVLTEENESADACRIDHGIAHEQAGVLQGESVLKSDVAGNAERQARRRVEGELDDGDASMGEWLDVKLRFWEEE